MAIDLDVHGNTKPLEAAVQAAVNRIRRTPIKITIDDKGATQPLGNMKRGADEFTKSMEAANARILAFGASMAIINGVADAFKGMVRNMVEVEKAMADINVVMGLSAQNLDKFGDGLFKVAKEAGAAFNVAAQAATEYARQGLSVEESLKRTKDALILTRLTGMDSAEAVKALTAAMNTYGSQIKDTTQLVSKFAAVDVKFAVSAEDFAQAISRAGQSALSAGVDIDEFVGIVTAAQQKTARGGAVIGNSLKTIFTRIGRTDTLNQLESLGVAVRDIEGNVLGAKTILSDLANTFDTLSAAQKAQIAQTVGGVFQINILKAVLSDAAKQNGILAEASRISAAATDESIQKNEQLRNTMSAMATETGLAIKQVSAQIGEIMLAPGMEKILNTVKSFAEGIGGALGDGESAGGKFATGLLKGIGNVLTGPGLVMLTAVFFKLLGQAAKFTKESLTSLVGTTSEAQKQKAIQTSLVTLFGQNAALNKEMLRTDISRTEKEKIILGLLKAQVAEANALNVVSKQAASTLYRQGFGPNLTQGKRKAAGHIPNYADPERAQAARGGYAAGTIRSMSMPGEGPVIYNSAETVKNFAGFKQPAIMPPQSSKAGKNYQQAFGSIHGFDPYAAGGYIPNYAKTTVSKTSNIPKNLKSKELGTLNEDSSLILLTADSSADSKSQFFIGKDPRGDTKILNSARLASKRTTGYYKVNVPYYSLDKNDKDKKSKSDLPAIQEGITRAAANKALDIAKEIVGGEKNLKPYNKEQIKKTFNQGAFKGAAGSTFESAIAASLKSHLFKDYNARTDTSAIDLPYDPRVFSYFGAPAGAGKMGAEVKADLANNLQQGAAKKFYQVLAGGRAAWEYKDKDYKDKTGGRAAYAGLERRGSAYFKKAYGHIPNFADPLSDAIGREKAAGVPVSQIRVGSHGALMNKGNPLGLGVTNTHDEPNGLRDVFGANGFVPNYAIPTLSAGDMGLRIDKTQQQLADQYNKELKTRIDRLRKGNYQYKDFERSVKKLNDRYNVSSNARSKVNKELHKEIGLIQRNNLSRQQMSTQFQKSSLGRGTAKMGKMFSGNFGMMAMMGAPMAAGFLQGGGAGQTGAGGAMYSAGGALQGAATGGMMASMMAPMFGPAAPLVIGVGALGGALYGMISAAEENTKALEENAKNMGGQIAQSMISSPLISSALKDFGVSKLKIDTASMQGEFEKQASAEIEKRFSSPSKLESIFGLKSGGLDFGVIDFGDLFGQGEFEKRESLRSESETGVIAKQKEDVFLAKQRINLVKEAVQNVPIDEKFMAKSLNKVDGKYDLKERAFDKQGYLKELEKLDPKDEAAQEALKQIFEDQRVKAEKSSVNLSKENKAIILRLNLQKAIMLAQMKAKEAQVDIQQKYFNQSNMIDAQTKILGGLMSEEQKVRLKYNKSLIKNSETREAGERAAQDAMRLGILQDIKGSRGGNLEQALKQALFKDKDKDELANVKFEDLTRELNALPAEKLLAILVKIGEKSDEANKINEQRTAQYNNQVSILDKQKTLSDNISTAEYKTNDAIAKRKDLLANMSGAIGMSDKQLAHDQKMRGLASQLGIAQRLTNVGPGYQTRAQQEDFQINEKRIAMEDQVKTLEENRQQALKQQEVEKAKVQPVDTDRLFSLLSPEGGVITDEDQKEIANINKLIDEREKKLAEIEQKTKNINKETEEEISNAKKLLAEEEKRLAAKRAHETGPGAFGRGMSDAAAQMRDEVQYLDYELGQNIPRNLASGLATAMQETLNGAKSLDEALQGAAMNFLQMIQQAMLQKAAMQVVGAMGFSRGGNVRNYSRGGGVPAMVTDGEYVMGRDAVNKYGGSFMHSLNAGGSIPGFSNGGNAPGSALAANFGGGRGYKSGRAHQRKSMSGFFYSQSGNVGLEADRESLLGELAAEERARQAALAKKAKKRALIKQLVGTVASIGIGMAAQGLFGGAGGGASPDSLTRDVGLASAPEFGKSQYFDGWLSSNYPASNSFSVPQTGGYSSLVDTTFGSTGLDRLSSGFYGQYRGGPIRKYASGGHISGKSGIDQIPAMLSEGEYVIRASSARQIGKPTLDRINAGKFNEGGAVSEIQSSNENASANGGNTNNINISINLSKDSKSEETSESGSNKDPQKDMKALSDRIKKQVVAVIVEEQRPGGILQGTK